MADLIGKRFSMLTVTASAGRDKWRNNLWFCACDCGKQTTFSTATLRAGVVQSCGCQRAKQLGDSRRTHGAYRSPVYAIWRAMNQRCTNPKSANFPNYGGRGITVCKRWRESFEAFRDDMGERPAGCELERKGNNQGYEPGNCIWAPRSVQANNKRNNVYITIGEEQQTMAQWARRFGIPYACVQGRIRNGATPVEALLTPSRR